MVTAGRQLFLPTPRHLGYLRRMIAKKKVLPLSGSTRSNSSNHLLIRTIADLTADRLEWLQAPSITDLPHFNPDLDIEPAPPAVAAFRQLLRQADGIFICTPEYAHGVPGSLKNALDWTVGTADFSHKPTVLITASTDGRYGHAALLETLRVIEAGHVDHLQLQIPFIRTKIDATGRITDPATRQTLQQLMEDFIGFLIADR